MKRIISLIAIGFFMPHAMSQIPLNGVITVQNSKVNTGKTLHVPNTQVSSQNAQPNTTDNEGKFTLRFMGVESGRQVQILVTPYGIYKDYVVVNEKELQDITLGRIKPVSVYICKKSELEERRAEMVKINMQKYKDRINQLQKELDSLQDNYDYDNPRYKLLGNQIDSLNKAHKDMHSLVKEWAESLTTINLDDVSELYAKAYYCFANGFLDSVAYYLPDESLKQQREQLLKQQEEGKRKIEAGKILTQAGQQDMEITNAGLTDNAKSWMLKAKTMALENKYEQAIKYYEEAINTDSLNVDNLFDFARYLHSIREYAKAEKLYWRCLERYQLLEKENPQSHLADIARTLNRLGHLHSVNNEYQKAEEKYNEALEIRKNLAAENPKVAYLADIAATLNNLAGLHLTLKEYSKASEKYEESLKIYRKLVAENPDYLADFALTLNNLAIVHEEIKEYPQALKEHEESLEIRRKLVIENPEYLTDVAQTLNNIAVLHWTIKEYAKALKECEESLEIRRKLSAENPKGYLPNVATTLSNLALIHVDIKEYEKALAEYKEALEIYRRLVVSNPQAYSIYVAIILSNLAELYRTIKEYSKAMEEYKESLEIRRELTEKNSKVYTASVVRVLNDISYCCLFTKEYAQSEQYAREALELDSTALKAKVYLAHALLLQNRFAEAEKIYKELSKTTEQDNEKTYTQTILENLDELENADALPEERKADVEKVRKMISD